MTKALSPAISRYELDEGKLIDTIHAILERGRFPIWIAELHRARKLFGKQFPDLYDWNYTPADLTGYNANDQGDKLQIITCYEGGLTEAGKLIFPLFKLENVVDHEIDASSIWKELSRMGSSQGVMRVSPKMVANYSEKDLSPAQTRRNPLQKMLFRQKGAVHKKYETNPRVLKEAIETSFQSRYTAAMGVYFGSNNQDVPLIRACGVNRLGNRSQALASYGVDGSAGRAVSIAPEAPSCARNSLEDSIGEVVSGIKSGKIQLIRA